MPKLPRIGIPVPTSGDPAYNRLCWPDYAGAVRGSGGDPVEVRLGLSESEMTEIAATCHAFVLPGTPADVDPSRYGQSPLQACAPPDRQREEADLFLLEHAYLRRKPLLCICFGAQLLNVWRGGTLIQDLNYLPVNHAAGRAVAVAHTAEVATNSVIGSLLGECEVPVLEDGFLRLPVNSSHHQAVGIPGQGLCVTARCPQDGVIEAVEGSDTQHFVVAVQWHPERGFERNTASQRLFERLIREARSRMDALCVEDAAERVAWQL